MKTHIKIHMKTLWQRQSYAGMTQMQENRGMQKVLARQLKARPPANLSNWTDKCLHLSVLQSFMININVQSGGILSFLLDGSSSPE